MTYERPGRYLSAAIGLALVCAATGAAGGQDVSPRAMDQDVPGLPPTPVSKDQYKLAQDRIADDFSNARRICDSMMGRNRNDCLAEAQAKRKTAMAELDARYANTGDARFNARIAKAEADHAEATRKCTGFSGSARGDCLKEADRSLAQAKFEARAQFGKS